MNRISNLLASIFKPNATTNPPRPGDDIPGGRSTGGGTVPAGDPADGNLELDGEIGDGGPKGFGGAPKQTIPLPVWVPSPDHVPEDVAKRRAARRRADERAREEERVESTPQMPRDDFPQAVPAFRNRLHEMVEQSRRSSAKHDLRRMVANGSQAIKDLVAVGEGSLTIGSGVVASLEADSEKGVLVALDKDGTRLAELSIETVKEALSVRERQAPRMRR